MALEIIGAGFGRTGTLSLKLALEQLGFGPCYHMMEVLKNPSFAAHWKQAADNAPMNWDEVFSGYRSTVDWPACSYWKELSIAYPQAKVILSVRDPVSWHESTQKTIFSKALMERAAAAPPDANRAGMMKKILVDTFSGRVADRDHAIRVFNAHSATVTREIAPERLLVYRTGDGWAPLCTFLGVPIPATPYPQTNSSEEFGSIFPPLLKQ